MALLLGDCCEDASRVTLGTEMSCLMSPCCLNRAGNTDGNSPSLQKKPDLLMKNSLFLFQMALFHHSWKNFSDKILN